MRRGSIASIVVVAGVAVAGACGTQVSGTTYPREPAEGGKVAAVDWTREAGLAVPPHETWGASEVDIDHDGDLDAWISRHGYGADMWRNEANKAYVRLDFDAWPRRNDAGLVIDRHDCQWADVNRDRRPDAFCTTGRFIKNVVKTGRDNEMWINHGHGRFVDVGTTWHMGDVCTRGRHAVFFDANGDEWPDLFVGTETPRDVPDPCNRHPERYPNENSKLYINGGGTGFRYAPALMGTGPAGLGSRCAERIDYDRDGWADLFLCRDARQPMAIFHNEAGNGLVDVSSKVLPTTRVNDADVVDIDHDGDPDIAIAATRGFGYVLNTGGVFGEPQWIHDVPADTIGWAVAAGDADADGDADVYGLVTAVDRNPNDVVLLNDGLAFTLLHVPPAGGTADNVVRLHLARNGHLDFLVMNGREQNRFGRLQLIRVMPQA
jgi:hypothetical protein